MNRLLACTILVGLYYLICMYLYVTPVTPIVGAENDTFYPDSSAETMTPVTPMENF